MFLLLFTWNDMHDVFVYIHCIDRGVFSTRGDHCIMIVTPHHTPVQQSSARQIAAETWTFPAQLLLQWLHAMPVDLHHFSILSSASSYSCALFPFLHPPPLFLPALYTFLISLPFSSPHLLSPLLFSQTSCIKHCMCHILGFKKCMTDGQILEAQIDMLLCIFCMSICIISVGTLWKQGKSLGKRIIKWSTKIILEKK